MASACHDAKGTGIAVYDVSKITDLADRYIIVSGRSDRHVQGITNRIVQLLQEAGVKPDAIEGYEKAHWIVIDLHDTIVHVFYEPVRELYDIESLWHAAKKLDLEAAIKEFSKELVAA